MLDTDICSFAIRGGSARLREMLSWHSDCLCVSAVTAAELRFGARKRGSRKISNAVASLLSLLEIVPWDDGAATCYAGLRKDLEDSGQPIGHADMMIAASALATGSVVVTHNTAHFSRIEKLAIEDWA